MALINHAKREINAKIVYYGNQGTGKRESLQYIYDRIKPALRGVLKSPPTSGESLLFFDFSPFETPVFGDYRLRFHLYTLTGPVANPAAWKMTLKGADGLVIVADADPDQLAASSQAVLQLRDFLSAYGVGLNDTPCVLQMVSTRTEGDGAAETAATVLGLTGVQAVFSDPSRGAGVLDVLSRLSRQIMARIGQDDALKEGVVKAVQENAFEPAAPETAAPAPYVQGETAQIVPSNVIKADGAVSAGLAGEIECGAGVLRIPLEFSISGITRRLLVSVAVEELPVS